MRLIDANVVVKGLVEVRDGLKEGFPKRFQQETIRKALRVVEESPTINAEPVVRCTDCQSYDGKGWCSLHDTPMNRYDFCSYGERRDEDA